MKIEIIGWDLGGAHVKAVALDRSGAILAVCQEPCPLWQGLGHLHAALGRVIEAWAPGPECRHAITMTGELADVFADRQQGVATLASAMAGWCPPGSVSVFAGADGFIPVECLRPADSARIASANWLASGYCVAANLTEALFMDIGSTTTDILLICDHKVTYRGYTDCERMRYDELVYTGIVRTPVTTLTDKAPFEGEWIGLMAEQFATTADVYRLTGELPEHADQLPAADGGDKTATGSARRIARLFGRDADSARSESWRTAARFLREQQLSRIRAAVERQLSRGVLSGRAPWVGAGVGRFLARELAERFGFGYLDFDDLFSMSLPRSQFGAADCAPAASVARLGLGEVRAK